MYLGSLIALIAFGFYLAVEPRQIGDGQSADTAPQQAMDAAMAEKAEGMIEEMAPLATPDAVKP